MQADATEHIKAVIDRIKPEYLVRRNCQIPKAFVDQMCTIGSPEMNMIVA